MTLETFLGAPWSASHPHFKDSLISIHRAPEFSTGEVVLSSVYRSSGFHNVSEGQVRGLGDTLSKLADRARRAAAEDGKIQPDTWRTVLDRLAQSPKVAQQSSKRFMSLSPLVPDAALYSGAARLTGNPWNPGELVKRIVQLGSPTDEMASKTWARLHEALGVGAGDDVWARWLQGEFESRRQGALDWQAEDLPVLGLFPDADRAGFDYPAKQFVADLNGIVAAKGAMTRRQWISLLEAVLRIGTVSHVLWICDTTDRLWRLVLEAIENAGAAIPETDAELAAQVLGVKKRMLSFGHPAIPMLRNYASKYLSARLGLNSVFWALDDMGVALQGLGSIREIRSFVATVKEHREGLRGRNVIASFHELADREVRAIACKKGIGSNILEFAQYTLGQRQTMDETLRGYDQGYFLRKRGEARNSPWVLALGPASVLAMAHCCLHEVKGPRSVQRLAAHMSSYGIEFDLHGLNDSDLGRQLRMLGLVLDSPDAESGMLLVPPFTTS